MSQKAIDILNKMTLKEKLGQLVMCGFEDPFYDEHARILIEDYKVGNIILFARNVTNLKDLIKLNKDLYKHVLDNTGLIPFISIDQEGGMVTRIMNGATFCPGSMTISATNDPNNAFKVGDILGADMKALGINMNLAPSVDVNNNPLNPVIGVRSYGDDPHMVAKYGKEYIRGIQANDVIATAKHFPGHGDTNVDSHLGLATISYDLDRLENLELVPFKEAIDGGVKAIMSAHIIFKTLDDVPATLSKKVLTDLLRSKLGYEGLIVSDCMQMKAIDNLYTTERGVVMGINAGLNIACVCHSLERQLNSLKRIEDEINAGNLGIDVIDERVMRVIEAKLAISDIYKKSFMDVSVDELLKHFNNNNQSIAQEITDKSLTLVKGQELVKKGKTVLVGNVPFASTGAEDTLDKRNIIQVVSANCKGVDTYLVETNPTDIDKVVSDLKDYETIIYVTYNVSFNMNQAILANKLQSMCDNFYVISSRNPYDCNYLHDIKNIVCLYEYSIVSLNTITKYINGTLKCHGRLPLKISRLMKISASIYLGLDDYPLEANLDYLLLLKKYGINTVFVSGQMPEAKPSFNEELKKVLQFSKENNINIVLDVNKNRLEELEQEDLTKGLYAIRLDYGFSNEDVLKLLDKPYLLEFNASTINDKFISFMLEHNVNLEKMRLSYNFYPKPYTGMSYESVVEKTKYFHKYGFKVIAYISTIFNHRMPLYKGLVTIEDQRCKDITASISELNICGVDEVCFGDSFVTKEEIIEAVNHSIDLIEIPIIIKKGVSKNIINALLLEHRNRSDNSDYMIRSSIRLNGIKEEYNNKKINKKDVTIDNFNYLRYEGEVAIALKEMPASNAINVIGRCICNDFLIDNIKAGDKFKFIIKGEE